MDWLHCNHCAFQGDLSRDNPFHFTHCGHILCRTCLGASKKTNPSSPSCPVCGTQPVHQVPVGPNLKPEILELFTDVLGGLKANFKCFTFQSGQAFNLIGMHKMKSSTFAQRVEAVNKEMEEVKRKLAEITQERDRMMLRSNGGQQQQDSFSFNQANRQSYGFSSSAMAPPPQAAPMAASGLLLGLERPRSPTFSDMPINSAFSTKTPAAFKRSAFNPLRLGRPPPADKLLNAVKANDVRSPHYVRRIDLGDGGGQHSGRQHGGGQHGGGQHGGGQHGGGQYGGGQYGGGQHGRGQHGGGQHGGGQHGGGQHGGGQHGGGQHGGGQHGEGQHVGGQYGGGQFGIGQQAGGQHGEGGERRQAGGGADTFPF
jgi:hypothetical protein